MYCLSFIALNLSVAKFNGFYVNIHSLVRGVQAGLNCPFIFVGFL